MKRKLSGFLAVGVVSALASSSAFAADPAPTCEASKLGTSAKYASCRLKAESKAVKSGDMVDYSKCTLVKFDNAETKATDAGGSCPTTGDQTSIGNFIDACTESVAVALGGGGLPLDVLTCNTNLAICNNDLSSTNADLAACIAEPESKTTKTGQTTCWDPGDTTFPFATIPCAGSGQDGDGEHGVASSYTDNGDGTITDNKTGLMWEKLDDSNLAGLAGVHDWNRTYTWAQAFTKISDLNLVAFAGHTDWRLPNAKELETLKSYVNLNPAVDGVFNASCAPGCTVVTCSCTQSAYYWSSTTYQTSPGNAWFGNFSDAGSYYNNKTSNYHVRATRAGL